MTILGIILTNRLGCTLQQPAVSPNSLLLPHFDTCISIFISTVAAYHYTLFSIFTKLFYTSTLISNDKGLTLISSKLHLSAPITTDRMYHFTTKRISLLLTQPTRHDPKSLYQPSPRRMSFCYL